MENSDEVQIDPKFPNKVTFIGVHLASSLREEIIAVLTERRDCFVWSNADMMGIDLSIITHQLQVDPNLPQ